MGATLLSWTDRHPATVTEVFKKGKYNYFTVREDRWERSLWRHRAGRESVEFTNSFPSEEGEGREATYRIKESGYERCLSLTQTPKRFFKLDYWRCHS